MLQEILGTTGHRKALHQQRSLSERATEAGPPSSPSLSRRGLHWSLRRDLQGEQARRRVAHLPHLFLGQQSPPAMGLQTRRPPHTPWHRCATAY